MATGCQIHGEDPRSICRADAAQQTLDAYSYPTYTAALPISGVHQNAGRGNAGARADSMLRMQQTHGNMALQRYTSSQSRPVQRSIADIVKGITGGGKPSAGGFLTPEEVERINHEATAPSPMPTGFLDPLQPDYAPGGHLPAGMSESDAMVYASMQQIQSILLSSAKSTLSGSMGRGLQEMPEGSFASELFSQALDSPFADMLGVGWAPLGQMVGTGRTLTNSSPAELLLNSPLTQMFGATSAPIEQLFSMGRDYLTD
jgi:hypothetical protein